VRFAQFLAHPDVAEEISLESTVGFLALHGGLEPGTAEIARRVARAARASCYAVVQPDDMKVHVPSHQTDPTCSALLARFLAHVDTIVSVHGYFGRRELHSAVLVGGRDRDGAAALARTLRSALPDYRVIDDLTQIPRRLRGIDPRNPVNLVPHGVQVELPHPLRAIGPYGRGAHADRYRGHTSALVDALVDYADSSKTSRLTA